MEQQCLNNIYTHFLPKQLKPTKNCLEAVNSFNSAQRVKMCHNPMHLTNHKSQRQSSSVQTTFLPMFSQNRLKPTNNFLEVVNSCVRFSMVKRCHNPMHLANHKSQRQSSSVETTFIPMFSQKRLKHTKKFLVEVNSFVSFSMVKMCHNLMHLTNYKCLIWIRSVQTTLTPFCPKRG